MSEVFRNRSALILWGFFFWFALGCTAISWVMLRDGPLIGIPRIAGVLVCAVFWLATVGLAFAASRFPFVLATVGADGALTVVLRRGLRKERREFTAADIHGAELLISEDSEGSPYYRVRVAAGEGFHVDIGEGHNRQKCEKTRDRFNTAYGRLTAGGEHRRISRGG